MVPCTRTSATSRIQYARCALNASSDSKRWPAMALRFPRLRRGGETFFLGIAESFDAAHALALDQAYDHLVDEQGIDPFEAYALISARCDMRLGGPASAIVMAVLPDD